MPATAKRNGKGRVDTLTDKLVAALCRNGALQTEPLVVENQILQTKSAHVVVIWDAWKDLSPADRSEAILAAYAEAKRLRGSTITVSMGLTGEEALRMGLLSYGIVTTRRHGDDVSLDQLSDTMAKAGGIAVKVGSSTQLRFPTLESAENAYRRLSQKVPGPYWAIVHDQPTAG